MIVVKIMGGLGNQMFQYAFGMALSKKNNILFKIDINSFENYKLRNYELNIFNLQIELASKKEINKLQYIEENIIQKILRKIEKGIKPFSKRYYIEKEFSFNILNDSENMYYEGYWQSEKYFLKYKDTLLKEFTLNNDLSIWSRKYKKNIIDTNSISLHIRRGDYISNPKTNSTHGTCDLEYYKDAVKLMNLEIENPIFYIFSDDLQWAKKHLTFIENLIFIELDEILPDSEEMYLMSQCKHNIIANSSFSWWGAWLNQNDNKKVIAPKKWFNDKSINTNDLIPNSWIKL